MTKRLILRELKAKNIVPVSVEYVRGVPTPSGYTNGYDIELSDKTEELIYELDNNCACCTFMEFSDVEEVMFWLMTLPTLPKGE
jgi:hypothetical protein